MKLIVDTSGDGAGSPLHGAAHLAVDASERVYVTGSTSDNVFRISDPLSTFPLIEVILDSGGDGLGNPLSGPNGIAVGPSGNVYVAGDASNNVFAIGPGCGASGVEEILDATGDGTHGFSGAIGVAVDGAERVFVAGDNTHNVFMITDPCGANFATQIIDGTGDGQGHTLSVPLFVAVDGSGNAYVTASGSDNVFRIADPGGANSIDEILDTTGDGVNALVNPEGIAVDSAGNVYVASSGSDVVFRIEDPGGVSAVQTVIDSSGDGSGDVTSGNLDEPLVVAVDASDDLYVTGYNSSNAFKIEDPGGLNAIEQIIDFGGDKAGNFFAGGAGIVAGESAIYVAGYATANVFPEPSSVLGLTAGGLALWVLEARRSRRRRPHPTRA